MATLGIALPPALDPREIAARSRRELDRTLTHDGELTIASSTSDAVLVGAFQRGSGIDAAYAVLRRGSGGAAVRVGPGTLWVSLALARPSALVSCDPGKLVNRYVRPLLRALGTAGAPARYFGRDWISVAHRPVAAIGFAHDASTERAHVEAFVAVRTPFALGPRVSFMDKEPATLEDVVRKSIDIDGLAHSIQVAYAASYAREPSPFTLEDITPEDEDVRAEPPWATTVAEAIGEIGAGPDRSGRFRVGGDLLASRDAIAALEAHVVGVPDAEVSHIVDSTLAAPGIVVDGVRSLGSIATAILQARREAAPIPASPRGAGDAG